MITSRRRFFLGASAALVAAPAIVRVAANLMPVSTRAFVPEDLAAKLAAEDREFLESMVQMIDATFRYGVRLA